MTNTERFWETKRLSELSSSEWERLCDGCGLCCLHKLRDEDTDTLMFTDVACRLLDLNTCQCASYSERFRKVPDCIALTPKMVHEIDWLPPSCAYRLMDEGKPLPDWHPLLTGHRESVHQAGISGRGRIISERYAGPLERHIVDWPGEDPLRPPLIRATTPEETDAQSAATCLNRTYEPRDPPTHDPGQMGAPSARFHLGGTHARHTTCHHHPRHAQPLGQLLLKRAHHAVLAADSDAGGGTRQYYHP